MIFTKIPLDGNAYIIDIVKNKDDRGFFSRTVCIDEFSKHNINPEFVQQSISFNPRIGTIRGMHWQREPSSEEKLVRVTRGAVFDVVVDIKPNSSTYKHWHSVELTEENRRQIYIPKGFAHGFQTIMPGTEVQYEMTARYKPEASLGFCWNDSDIGIEWPISENILVGKKDSGLPNFRDI
jgi:dTDP-4-dehydrorhamnose 3,5-epimerase